jgi:F0F1-type ATP synthase membrane subunit a
MKVFVYNEDKTNCSLFSPSNYWFHTLNRKAVGTALLASLPMLIWQAFCAFIGPIQAYIFVTLTMVYIAHRLT